ncbi:unnamed protein product [Didymodactylos carnosus]|uniref:Uncharacterized protein n=1 Tax=Didymodactylos carnosus TaxID=1234261 RepID=A0A815EF46_9BILA|nr:unnamed protein product [Didymodactylos carnosus]CAF4149788.1 unnamed protein product [Didymodactylos carnosus]
MTPYALPYIILLTIITQILARISPRTEFVYNVVGCVSGRFHTCDILDIYPLADEETLLAIVDINNAGPWSLPSSYLEIMYKNGTTIQRPTGIFDEDGRCGFGAKFISLYGNNQDDSLILMCSPFTFPGGETAIYQLKVDIQTASITRQKYLKFQYDTSFSYISSQASPLNNVYFLISSFPQGSNYFIGKLNLINFTVDKIPLEPGFDNSSSSKLPFSNQIIYLDSNIGAFNYPNDDNNLKSLLFSTLCGYIDPSQEIPSFLCTYKYTENEFRLIGMNLVPNARSHRNIYLYSKSSSWGLTATSAIYEPLVFLNTNFNATTNSSHDILYGATFNDTDATLALTQSTIHYDAITNENNCFYLATNKRQDTTNSIVVQQLQFGKDFDKPVILLDSTTDNYLDKALLFTTKQYLFVTQSKVVYTYSIEC